ncbi:hypothetical protein [Robbsia sp. KACC 23696]|uniref:hypothetical protein n=1 Tax=Robbsia sp. KACC 23696 TaxID=3149231 RepID=UPI00325C2B26
MAAPFSTSRTPGRHPAVPAFAALLLAACLPLQVSAQDRDTPVRRYTPPPRIEWELTVLTDGKQTDRLSGNTAVGQSATVTRHWDVRHTVGCEGAETQPLTFTRTLTLSPLGVDSHQVIGFSVDTQETIDDDAQPTVRSDGCALPPTPRVITAHHPEWDLTAGQTVSWTIVPHHPTLVYQLTAHVVDSTAGGAAGPASDARPTTAVGNAPSGGEAVSLGNKTETRSGIDAGASATATSPSGTVPGQGAR